MFLPFTVNIVLKKVNVSQYYNIIKYYIVVFLIICTEKDLKTDKMKKN